MIRIGFYCSPAAAQMGLKSVQRLPCPQRETVRAVIAQSQSHLHLHMMNINIYVIFCSPAS